jgi:CCR4-NOT transcription complex subunit 1
MRALLFRLPGAKSKVFKPPNPWLMAVVSLLGELYHFVDLELEVRVEVLRKRLNLDTVGATTILKNRCSVNALAAASGLPEYVNEIDSLPMNGLEARRTQTEGQVISLSSAVPTECSEGDWGAYRVNFDWIVVGRHH